MVYVLFDLRKIDQTVKKYCRFPNNLACLCTVSISMHVYAIFLTFIGALNVVYSLVYNFSSIQPIYIKGQLSVQIHEILAIIFWAILPSKFSSHIQTFSKIVKSCSRHVQTCKSTKCGMPKFFTKTVLFLIIQKKVIIIIHDQTIIKRIN